MHDLRRAPRLPAIYLLGPAFVAAIAYVDPGNVAANVSAGWELDARWSGGQSRPGELPLNL